MFTRIFFFPFPFFSPSDNSFTKTEFLGHFYLCRKGGGTLAMMTAGLLCVGFALLQTDRWFMRVVTCTAPPPRAVLVACFHLKHAQGE